VAAFDLALIRQFQTGHGQRLLDTFMPGSPVGIHFEDRDIEFVLNGFVTSRQGEAVWADFMSKARRPHTLLSNPQQRIDIRQPGPIALSTIQRGQTLRVVESHPQGYSLQMTGVVTDRYNDSFELAGWLWFNWELSGRRGGEIMED
jgi:hypothetical protein